MPVRRPFDRSDIDKNEVIQYPANLANVDAASQAAGSWVLAPEIGFFAETIVRTVDTRQLVIARTS